jgi:ferritin-like metal-binding protein YciE
MVAEVMRVVVRKEVQTAAVGGVEAAIVVLQTAGEATHLPTGVHHRMVGEAIQEEKAAPHLVAARVLHRAVDEARVEAEVLPAADDKVWPPVSLNYLRTTINNRKMKQQSNQGGNKTGSRNINMRSNGNGSKQGESMLENFFTDQLKDMYYAEQQLLKALPKMESESTTEELEEAFNNHARQTEKHVKRLERVFKIIGKKPEGKRCEAMDGLIKEAETIIRETKEGSMTRDAALIIAAQKVEHYEIASYGGLVQLAITMQLHRAADILEKTLFEEEDTDQLLTYIAESSINMEAEDEGVYSWQKEETEESMEA